MVELALQILQLLAGEGGALLPRPLLQLLLLGVGSAQADSAVCRVPGKGAWIFGLSWAVAVDSQIPNAVTRIESRDTRFSASQHMLFAFKFAQLLYVFHESFLFLRYCVLLRGSGQDDCTFLFFLSFYRSLL